MKKLYKNIALFCAPILLVLALLPITLRDRYIALKDDCFDHGLWIHDRIFLHEEPIDIVAIGSSHTLNGVNDREIEKQLGDKWKAANLGYCRLGRDLHYSILNQVVSAKKPQCLLLEIREDENHHGHKVFPHLGTSKDIWFAPLVINKKYLQNIYKHSLFKVQLLQENWWHDPQKPGTRQEQYGFSSHPDTCEIAQLDKAQTNRQAKWKKHSETFRGVSNAFPRSYLDKIKKLCDTYDIKLFFLHLPSYGVHLKPPRGRYIYDELGTVLIPPDHILDNRDFWDDVNHLNIAGGTELSKWVAQEIKEHLK